MRKADLIRQILTDSIPSLPHNPDQLEIYIDEGKVIATGANSASFELQYTLNIIIKDFALPPEMVFVTLIDFIRNHQPELLHNPDYRQNGFKFIADKNNNETLDLAIYLTLIERFIVRSQAGTNEIRAVGEPVITPTIDKWQVYVSDELQWEINND